MPNRNIARRRAASHQRHIHRYVLYVIAIVLFAAAAVLFLSYSNWKQVQDDRILQAKTREQNEKIDKAVKAELAARIEAKKKVEEAARSKAAEAEAAIKAGQRKSAQPADCSVSNPDSLSVIINKKHCFSPLTWQPSDISSVYGYPMRSVAAAQMIAMMNDATAAGVGFSLSSAYRSYDNQVATYNTWVAVNGSTAAADTVSARPGYSEHQTGLAADLKIDGCVLECFAGTRQYGWLTVHAADYGFIERYPAGMTYITGYEPEAWHWRYVGTQIAKDMKAKGIITLEAYLGISGGNY